MKHNVLWLAILLAASVGMSGCNSELEEGEGVGVVVPTPVDPVDPIDPIDPTAPIDPTDPVEFVGTWENKDEDGDGVPDEQDDYPFDASRSEYELVYEEEFNNHLAVANSIKDGMPFRVNGSIQQKLDIDLFKFDSVGRKAVTVILKSENSDFVPYVTILNKNGESLTPVPTNYSPVGWVRYAVTFTLVTDGVYYLVVNDEQREGAPEYSYQVHVFQDEDVDGLDDSLESAYGLSNIAIDTDNDRIFDANEFYVYEYADVYAHDIDKDGVPNWADDDSDGDGILDRVEGIFDLERDGFASFVDLDSDGNGINDDAEVKDTSMAPRDLDNDGLYDFLDVDDDNDGLLDINDNDPSNALRVAMPGEPGYKNIVYLSYIYSGDEIHGIQIAGEAHSISGYGLTGSGFLVFDMGKEVPPINMSVTSNSSDKINFAMPRGAVNLFFVAEGFRSNKVPISYSDEDIPIFNALNNQYFSEGELVELSGKNFFEDTKVIIDELIIEPTINSSSNLTFILPSGLPSEVELTLKTSYGKGNSRIINVGKTIVTSINTEGLNSVDVDKLFAVSLHSPTKERRMFNANRTTDVVVGSGHDIILVMYQDEQGKKLPYLYQAAFGEQTGVNISSLDSAISVTWYKSGIRRLIPASEWSDKYHDIGSLSEIKNLSDYISAHLDNPKYTADSQYITLEQAAVNAVREFGKALSEKKNQSIPTLMRENSEKINSVVQRSTTTSEYKPLITSDWGDSEGDIDIYPTKKSDGFLDNVFDGNLGVDNDTALFLSAQFSRLDNPDNTLHHHIASHFDEFMVGPQDWGILNISTSIDFPQCKYHNCKIEVVTPGLNGNQPISEEAMTAQEIILFRTALEQVILPTLSLVLDRDNLGNDKAWIADLVNELYPTFKKAVELSQQKTPTAIMAKFFDIVVTDLANANGLSRLVPIIARKLGTKDIIEIVVERIAAYVAPLAVPIAGEVVVFIKALHELLGVLNIGNTVLNTALDIDKVPAVVNFEVTWPVVITSLTPAAINRKTIASAIQLTIEGQGFFPIEILGSKFYPEVQVIDTKGTEDESDDTDIFSKVTSMQQLAIDGTAIDFLWLDQDKVKNAVGPLRVFVEVSDAKPYKDIDFYDGIKIVKITPDVVFPGMVVNIDGVGFSYNPNYNLVTFQGKTGRIRAQVQSAGLNRLKVVVPDGVASGVVNLSVKGEQSDNGYPVTVLDNGITARFGDNGNLADDIFTVQVAGKTLQMQYEGQRSIDLFKSLIPGEYEVILTADTVPDARGTYFVCFSDNVEILNGDPLSAKELLAQKGDKVHWNIKVNPGTGKLISHCAQAEIQKNRKLMHSSIFID